MKALALVGLLVVLGLVGTADLEDAQRDEALYCEFVADGTWPAYNSEIDCNKEWCPAVKCGLMSVLDKLTRKENERNEVTY
tara:strand:- start:12 stop:254 length:243 start_codon:yes stop_codon:yes gene_type:complete